MSDVSESNDVSIEPEVPPAPVRRLYENTPLIRTTDMAYPLYLRDFRAQHRNVTMTTDSIDAYVVAEYNYIEVWLVAAPTEGDVIKQGKPELRDDGLYYQTWTVRPFNEQELAYNLLVAQEERRYMGNDLFDQDLLAGVKVTHKGTDYQVPANIGARADWSLSLMDLMNKDSAADYVVRTDTAFVSMTVAEATEFYHNAIDAYRTLVTAHYKFLDLVNNAVLITDVPEVPPTFVGAVFDV